ncbi:hypothetical protein SY83_20725 [Paenibacillus swuensis]|uniref:Uncharacterized protein n=1 Tax=Paenibacillus swuensis TaxID=1178515 RepID=A0A172TPV0_9BACL|nr:Cof-type HAD-IIB family hydrolase [Paenibacillus swuensis]ANE49081.1 hypothetical protein SY83_20725 [Paenibacillus swuensis]
MNAENQLQTISPPYKLLVLDMDGTLFNSSGIISEVNKLWLRKAREAGIEIALASGRHVRYVSPTAKELDLTLPMITNNGCEVWAADGSLLHRTTMTKDQILWLRELALEYHTAYRVYAAGSDFESALFPAEHVDEYIWLMFMFRTPDPTVKESLWERCLANGEFELTMASPAKFDVNPKGVSKGHAIQRLCEEHGISLREVAAIGDGLNDASMLRIAGLGIAMGNAEEEVKALADWVTLDCDQNGVAHAIQYILGGSR